jgi:hypothetical protein
MCKVEVEREKWRCEGKIKREGGAKENRCDLPSGECKGREEETLILICSREAVGVQTSRAFLVRKHTSKQPTSPGFDQSCKRHYRGPC